MDKFFLLFGGFVVTAMVARHLGPEQMGKISYGLIFSALCTTVSQWGGSYTVFNTAVSKRGKAVTFIRSTLKTRFCIYLFTWSLSSIYLYNSLVYDDFLIVSLVCLSGIFLGLDIYTFFFNATLKSRINAKSSMVAKSLTMLLRVGFVIKGLNVHWFILPLVIEGFIIFFLKMKKLKSEEQLEERNAAYNEYFRSGLVFLGSGLMVFLYAQINRIVLKEYVSFEDLGIYSVGLALAGAWTFIPMSIGISFLTKALASQKIEDYSFTYFLVLAVSIPVILFVFIFKKTIIVLTFGEGYLEIAPVLPYMCITALFTVYGFLNNRHIGSMDRGGRYLQIKVFVIAIISFPLTIYLVSIYGLFGAVFSILIVELFSFTMANYFKSNAIIFRIQLKVFSFETIKKSIS